MSSLVLAGLTLRHRDRRGQETVALREVSLSVEEGEYLVVIGPSGAGKTSLLRLIAGLDVPSAGTVHLDGRSMAGVSPAERDVALVFQDHPLFPHLDVERNLGFALSLQGRRPELGARVAEAASALGLGGLLGRLPETLSGGERQRVALGTAMVRRPRLLLLDEPLAQLDAPLRLQLRGELRDLHRRFGLTVVHVTHDQAEAMALADRLAVLHGGRLLQVGPPMEVYRRPAHGQVAEFLGSPPMNLVRGVLRRGEAGGDGSRNWTLVPAAGAGAGAGVGVGWSVVPPAGMVGGGADGDRLPVVLGVWPEDLGLAAAIPPGMTGFEVTLEAIERLGSESLVRLRSGGVRWVARARAEFTAPAGPGAVRAWFDPQRAHWFEEQTGRRL